MDKQYLQELFRVTCVHKYYKDNLAGILSFEPTDPGAKAIKSYGLHFKPRKNGFVVVAPCQPMNENSKYELVTPFNPGTKLSFAIFNHDTDFFENSDLPFDPPGEYVYYLNNLDATKRTTFLLLDKKGIEDTERVMLHNKKFSGDLQWYKNHRVIKPKVYDCRGQKITETAYDLDIDVHMKTYSLDLARLPDGIYTVQYNEAVITCYCAGPSFIRRIPLLIVEIFTDTDVPEQYRLIERIDGVQYIAPKNFMLHFGDYSLYWRYTFIPIKIHHHVWLKVRTNNDAYLFTPEKEKICLLTGLPTFTSKQVMDITDENFEVNLYRQSWIDKCRCHHKHYYCSGNYGVIVDNCFMCREYRVVHGKKHYPYQCPAKCEDKLVGRLPLPDEIPTFYYYEDDKHIAEMKLYVVRKGNEYFIMDIFAHDVIESCNQLIMEFRSFLDIEWGQCSVTVYDRKDGIKLSQSDLSLGEKAGNTDKLRRLYRARIPSDDIDKGDKVVYAFSFKVKGGIQVTTNEFTYIVTNNYDYDYDD